MALKLASIMIYPIKSSGGLSLSCAKVEERGLAHDRRWMVVDERGRFVTGRQEPKMVLLRARPKGGSLLLSAPNCESLCVARPSASAERIPVQIWNDHVHALVAGTQADSWISAVLGRTARLVFMDESARRPVNPDFSSSGDEVSFADGYPVLLVGQASLDGLNAHLRQPVPMARFRPNLVVEGGSDHEEDQWRRITIGEIPFDVVKPCTRCVFTTVDPDQGSFDPTGEPLKTLLTYRRTPRGIAFGQYLIARGAGSLSVGDPILVHVD